MPYASRIILGLLLTLFFDSRALAAANIVELFKTLPDTQTQGLSIFERNELLGRTGQGASGYSAPDSKGFWIQLHNTETLTVSGIHRSPVTYKIFQGFSGFQLLAICRSRQTSGPTDIEESETRLPYDLTLYQVGHQTEMNAASLDDFFPPVSILDFITSDTLKDYKAKMELEIINQDFEACLTCHASTDDPKALDILTVTSINGHPCNGFLAQFKLLPLSWNGEYFTKPHDRAASQEDRRPGHTTTPHGLYYRNPNL